MLSSRSPEVCFFCLLPLFEQIFLGQGKSFAGTVISARLGNDSRMVAAPPFIAFSYTGWLTA